ncbi:MAG: hypothetical protein ABIZ80_10645, partial [Bryobacteraceae bacterium]
APKPFAIVQAGIHQIDDGPPVPPGATFVPGEVVFFSFLMDGFKVAGGPARHVSITYKVLATDPKDVLITEQVDGKIDLDLNPEDKEWRPKIRQSILIPPLAGSGAFKVRVVAKDELAGTTATREVSFEVRGHQVEPADTLVVRNFRFYRGEDEQEPLKVAAYRPGDTVWARFDIAGFKLGPGNLVDVAYLIAVSGPGERVLFRQAEPSVEKKTSFYPMQYVPSQINLSLQPTIRPEQYFITVSVQDRFGNQTYETKQPFRVE